MKWSANTMNCRKTIQLLSAYLDEELRGTEMLQIREHLSNCDQCAHEYEQVRRMKQLMASVTTHEPRIGLEASIMAHARHEMAPLPSISHSSLKVRSGSALAIPRTVFATISITLLLTLCSLWPVQNRVSVEFSPVDASACVAEHSTYQSDLPLAGGASSDMTSSDARVRLAEYVR
jgi:anti-sigma factor RsiW